jgi:hypothetical protein
MKCPHCTVNIHPGWSVNAVHKSGHNTSWQTHIMECPNCHEDILSLVRLSPLGHPSSTRLIHPEGSNRGPVSPDVPAQIAADYDEAAKVLPISPKASAALSRRCAQAVLREACYMQRDLPVQIDAVLKETDLLKAIPKGCYCIGALFEFKSGHTRGFTESNYRRNILGAGSPPGLLISAEQERYNKVRWSDERSHALGTKELMGTYRKIIYRHHSQINR